MTVADNQAVAVHVSSQHHMQLRLGTGFQTQVVTLTMTDNLLHNRTHLIHLDGEDNKMLTCIRVFLLSFAEALISLLDAVIQDIRETQQHRSRNMTCSQMVHHLLQVYLHRVLLGRYIHMPLIIDTKVINSPTLNVVEFLRVLNSPLFHLFL